MSDVQNTLTYYNINIMRRANFKIKPRDVFADTLSKSAPHVYVMCDHTFASEGYDIGKTDAVYKEKADVSSLPYHFVIKHIPSEIVTYDGEKETIMDLEAGAVFLTRSLNLRNECNNSEMIGGANAITICLTIDAGSWLTGNPNPNKATADSLKLLLRYLMSEYGMNFDKLHNMYNNYIGDYAVNPDSWNGFIEEIKESMRASREKFSSEEDGDTTVINMPEGLTINSDLEHLAIYCCPNASEEQRNSFKRVVAQMNDDIWPGYEEATEEQRKELDKKYIPYDTKIIIPGAKGREAVENLQAQNIHEYSKNTEVIGNVVTVNKLSDYERWLKEWNDPADVHHEGDDSIYLQNRGGKSEMKWRYQQMELPGYHNALLQFDNRNSNESSIFINFLISPSSVRENRAVLVNNVKTLGGWVGTRAGSSVINISFAGYMLDIYEQMERHRFLADYKNYIESQKDSSHSYYNLYNCKLIIEGRDYYGYVSGLSFSKDAEKPYIYQYNISFTAYSDKEIYDPEWALVPWYKAERNKGTVDPIILDDAENDIYAMLHKLLEEGWAGHPQSAAYRYLKSQIDAVTLANIDEVRAETQEWLNVLNYLKSKNNEWTYWLRQLIDTDIVSNLDVWGYENSEPEMAAVIALFDKISGDTLTGEHSDATKHWSQPNAVSLYLKGIIKNKDEWFDENWNIKYADQLCSRALFMALCDGIGGAQDYCSWFDNEDRLIIMDPQGGENRPYDMFESLKKTIGEGADSLTEHWSNQHVWSLGFTKDIIRTNEFLYWMEDPEATVTSEYAIPLICRSRESAIARCFPEYPNLNWSTGEGGFVTKRQAVIWFVRKTVGNPWTSGERKNFFDSAQPYLISLYTQGIIREWPTEEGGNSTTWAYYDENGTLCSNFTDREFISRAMFLGLCDNVGGKQYYGMDPDVAAMSDDEVFAELTKEGVVVDESEEFALTDWHPAFRNVLSLYKKGVFGETISSYWVEDSEATVQRDYFYTIFQEAQSKPGKMIGATEDSKS